MPWEVYLRSYNTICCFKNYSSKCLFCCRLWTAQDSESSGSVVQNSAFSWDQEEYWNVFLLWSLFMVFELCIRRGREVFWSPSTSSASESFLPVGSLPMDDMIHPSHILLIGRQYLKILLHGWRCLGARHDLSVVCAHNIKKIKCDVLVCHQMYWKIPTHIRRTHMLFKSSNSNKNMKTIQDLYSSRRWLII